MNHLEKLFKDCDNKKEYFKNYSKYLNQILLKLDIDAIQNVIDCFLAARKNGRKIFFAGNGGSAATASHFAQDLAEVCRKAGKECFRTLSLTDNVSFITALGNDYGYDTIFTGQLKNLYAPGDMLVAISASGNSPNVVEAIKMVKELGGTTIGLVGFDGGIMAQLCDHVIHVPSNKGEYGPVEDVHLILDHMMTSFITMTDLAV